MLVVSTEAGRQQPIRELLCGVVKRSAYWDKHCEMKTAAIKEHFITTCLKNVSASFSRAFLLTDCHERVGELVLLFGRGQLVFERELLQWFAPLQRLALPLALHHLLQTEAYADV